MPERTISHIVARDYKRLDPSELLHRTEMVGQDKRLVVTFTRYSVQTHSEKIQFDEDGNAQQSELNENQVRIHEGELILTPDTGLLLLRAIGDYLQEIDPEQLRRYGIEPPEGSEPQNGPEADNERSSESP